MSNHRTEAAVGGAALPSFGPGYGRDMHRQPARTLSADAEMTSQVSLPTGQKVYELDVSIFQQGLGQSAWKTYELWSQKPHEDRSFPNLRKFCKYIAVAAPTKSDEQCAYRVTNYPSRPLISHQLLKSDGFMLGRLVTCAADEDVLEPSPFAVYERCSLSAPNLHVPGEYVVLLFPSVNDFIDRGKRFKSHILEIRALCMYLPLFMPHLLEEEREKPVFGLIGKGSFGAAFRISYKGVAGATQLTCVIKRVDIQRRSFKLVMRESWFLQQLQHRNIACLLHQYMSPNSAPNDKNPTIYLVQKDCGENLLTFLRNRFKTSQKPCSVVPAYGVLHRDIKEDNCLVMEECGVIVAKLIDFGLAKRFYGDRANVPDVPGYFEDNGDDEQGDLQDNDDAAADLRRPDNQSKLFMNHTQYAPETRFPRNEFTYKSDLWALGTLILWPMLFCACQENLDKCAHPIGRKFPFQALWGSSSPQAFTQERLQSLIQSNLLDKFPKHGDFDMFERICEILSKMCAHNAEDRWTAQECLVHLNTPRGAGTASAEVGGGGGGGSAVAAARSNAVPVMNISCSSAAPLHFGPGYGYDLHISATAKKREAVAAGGAATAATVAGTGAEASALAGVGDDTFESVCEFIDNFCASGHFRGSAEMRSCSGPEIQIFFKFESPVDPSKQPVYVYETLLPKPSWPECLFRWPEWLHVRKEEPRKIPDTPLTPWDCLAPDFYVKPPQAIVRDNSQPRSIFLPRNLFCFGIGRAPTMLDVSNLTLLFQTEWFTVFRYCSPGESWIIKHTSLNSGTFKYLLQEKAMFSYLNHARIANEILEFRDFHPLVMVTDLDPVSKAENPFTGNDRFVFYEDGGRPMDIQLQAGWRPTLAAVEKIARQLLEVLSYLLVKKVVHRTLSLGTIVRNEHDDVKLISLGHSKYIGKLDYEEKVQRFSQEWKGVLDDGAGRDRSSHFSPRSSAKKQNKTTENEEDPTLQTQNKKTKKYDCAHPASSEEPPAHVHDWYSAGRVIEILLQKWLKTAEKNNSLGPEETVRRQKLERVVFLLKDDTVANDCSFLECLSLLDVKTVDDEPISDSGQALLSFIQALLRRRFH